MISRDQGMIKFFEEEKNARKVKFGNIYSLKINFID